MKLSEDWVEMKLTVVVAGTVKVVVTCVRDALGVNKMVVVEIVVIEVTVVGVRPRQPQAAETWA